MGASGAIFGLAGVLIGTVLFRLTEPVLGPIRRLLPNFGGIDFSPIVAIIALIFIEKVIFRLLGPLA